MHENKRFNDIILLEFIICQCSNNAWKCEQWCFIKDLVQKFKILVFIDHLSCLFNNYFLLLSYFCGCDKWCSVTSKCYCHFILFHSLSFTWSLIVDLSYRILVKEIIADYKKYKCLTLKRKARVSLITVH